MTYPTIQIGPIPTLCVFDFIPQKHAQAAYNLQETWYFMLSCGRSESDLPTSLKGIVD